MIPSLQCFQHLLQLISNQQGCVVIIEKLLWETNPINKKKNLKILYSSLTANRGEYLMACG